MSTITKKTKQMNTQKTFNSIAIIILILLNIIILLLFSATSNKTALYMLPFGIFALYLVLQEAIQYDKKNN